MDAQITLSFCELVQNRHMTLNFKLVQYKTSWNVITSLKLIFNLDNYLDRLVIHSGYMDWMKTVWTLIS